MPIMGTKGLISRQQYVEVCLVFAEVCYFTVWPPSTCGHWVGVTAYS